MKDFRFLGQLVEDKITGFSGVVTSISYDVTGCIQALVKPRVNSEGAMLDGTWIDTKRLVSKERIMPLPDSSEEAKEPGRKALPLR